MHAVNLWVHAHPWPAILAVGTIAWTLAILLMALLAIAKDSDRRVEELMGQGES